jgi:hypothetical protein
LGGALHGLLAIDPPATLEPLLLRASAVRIRHGMSVKLVLSGGSNGAAAQDRQLVDLLAEARAA